MRTPISRIIAMLAAAAMPASALLSITAAPAASETVSSALHQDAGCLEHELEPNDDDSSPKVTLPFRLNYFGVSYDSLWVNNNGNVTFTEPQSDYTPYTIRADIPPMIAPFFADVDTTGSGTVTYGETRYQGYTAFCVNWTDVGYYDSGTDKTNTFQLLLVSRPDVSSSLFGAFDIVLNYDRITWESGDASGGDGGLGGIAAGVGYSNGDGKDNHFHEFIGSLQPGAFLDTNPNGLVHRSTDGDPLGRYTFHVRSNGVVDGDISMLKRNFPTGQIGYSFDNRGLDYWLDKTDLDADDVVTHDTMQRTFSDWNSVALEGDWYKFGLDETRGDYLNEVISGASGGLCFGMALSGARFDSGFEALFDSTDGRSGSTWNKPFAYDLPAPETSESSRSHDIEFLQMVTANWAAQKTQQMTASEGKQIDAYADPTSGFTAFRNQLISVMRDGDDRYDSSGKVDTQRGSGYAVLQIFLDKDLPLHPTKFGHAIVVYSLADDDNGDLLLDVWDNNEPNEKSTIRVSPDGSWEWDTTVGWYDRFDKTYSLRTDSEHDHGRMTVQAAFAPHNLNFHPGTPVTNATFGTGAFVDVPAGVEATATDASGRPVPSTADVAAGGGALASETLNITSGTGRVTFSGSDSASVTIRGTDAITGAQSLGVDPVVIGTSLGEAEVTLARGNAELVVAYDDTSTNAIGMSRLTIEDNGAVSFAGTGASGTVLVTGRVDGASVTATLFHGPLGEGVEKSYTPEAVADALADASGPQDPGTPEPPADPSGPGNPGDTGSPSDPGSTGDPAGTKAQKVSIKAPKRVMAGKKFTVRGTVTAPGGKVLLQEKMKRGGRMVWRTIKAATVKQTAYSVRVRAKRGVHVYRIQRLAVPGYTSATSRTMRVVATKR